MHSEDDDDFVAMEIDEFNEIESNTTEIQLQNHKDKEKARWILNLRDENKLTQTCTDNILSNVTLLCSQLVDDIKQAVAKQLQECEASSDITEKVLQLLDNPDYKQPFNGLETKHRQLAFFKKHLGYVVCLYIIVRHEYNFRLKHSCGIISYNSSLVHFKTQFSTF